MFGFSNYKKECPVNSDTQTALEEMFYWLLDSFGWENIRNRRVMVPNAEDFPIIYDNSRKSVQDTMEIIAIQMEIDPGLVVLHIYEEGQAAVGHVFIEQGGGHSSGLYYGKDDGGKYHVGVKVNIIADPIKLAATLVHELAHIKLLGEGRIKENNEPLTDLTSVVFGLGIFNANVAFQTSATAKTFSWSTSGYLSQMEWGYALAIFAKLQGDESPGWLKFLPVNIKSDFKRSLNFIELKKPSPATILRQNAPPEE